jgi:hypothetical protein
MKVLLVEPILDRYSGSSPKGPEGMERERSRGVTNQTKRRDTGVPKIRVGLCKIAIRGR